MKIYDISMEISEDVQVYKNKEEKKAKLIQQYNFQNSSVYETQLMMNLHTGTHIDAPLHAIENGLTTETYTLDQFFGPCQVLDFMTVEERITAKDLEKYTIEEDTFILLKTKNSLDQEFNYNFIYLDESGAQYLVDKNIKGVGIDGLGIERNQSGHPTHKILLGKRIPILEGLRLEGIQAGYYDIAAFPIKIKNVEASPVRAVLIEK